MPITDSNYIIASSISEISIREPYNRDASFRENQTGDSRDVTLTIDLSAMCYIKNLDISPRVIDRINNSVISDSDAVKIAIGELLSSECPWVDFKLK